MFSLKKETPITENDPKRKPEGFTFSPLVSLLFLLITASLVWIVGRQIVLYGWQFPFTQLVSSPNGLITNNATPSPSQALESQLPPASIPETETVTITNTPRPPQESFVPGLIVYSADEAGLNHLFAYNPQDQPLTRLTYGDWDDIHPSLSPDGNQIAYTSNKNGNWDIFVLDLSTGKTIQITRDINYDGRPSWSSDGLWLAYEKYIESNLEIFIQPLDGSLDPLRITNHPGLDKLPRWHPTEKKILFTSRRDGREDIWIANIDNLGNENFLTNFSKNRLVNQSNPVWSPDGNKIAYIMEKNGFESIFVAELTGGIRTSKYIGIGSSISWSPEGFSLLTDIRTPDQSFLAAYDLSTTTFTIPPLSIEGSLEGITWGKFPLPIEYPSSLASIAAKSVNAPWELGLTPDVGTMFGRHITLDLPDVIAPNPALSAIAVEPFFALRDRALNELGYDLLSDLENAFVPLTEKLPPGLSNDWLYTGRAFSLHQVLIDWEYMYIIREDFGGQTFWRVYLKPLSQDGSMGRPISDHPWDFRARFQGNTTLYEAGGTELPFIPQGYWVDFTSLALRYGWERQPALSNWQSFYQGARFNVFAITTGLNWEDAMLQIYPPEIFLDPVIVP